jgi:hypothetical protein
MNKLISLALLAVLAFYGFRRCSPRDATGIPIQRHPAATGASEEGAAEPTPAPAANDRPWPASEAASRPASGEESRPAAEAETQPASAAEPQANSVPGAEPPEPPEAFTCQGKTRCSEMVSCEEATYYLIHCPGVQIDGDGDGVPCEQQWCGGR